MKITDTRLTDEQIEVMRHLYVYYSKTGLPLNSNPDVLTSLVDLGLADQYEDEVKMVIKNEFGINYVRSMNWTWGFHKSPNLPSPHLPT